MRGITLGYFLRRLGIFFLTIWIAASIIWLIPHLAPGDPISAMVARMISRSGFIENSGEIIAAWKAKFGLNDPLPVQYVKFLGNIVHLDFGYSLNNYPVTVNELIGEYLPWTVGLLVVAVTITFLLGNFLGAIMVWRKTPRLFKYLIPVGMLMTSLPSILAALFLTYVFAFLLNWFPLQYAYDALSVQPGLNPQFIGNVIQHGILPALSIVVVSFGYWTLGMRGMMITVEGEDYMQLARAKGLKPFYLLYRYMVRNAILPQITAFALTIGTLVGGQVLVEYVFSYQGMGSLIYSSILNQDYPVIEGATFILVFMTALAVLIIDLFYPLIDPRISYGRK
jgi:peptide/nickel transport system permease protein